MKSDVIKSFADNPSATTMDEIISLAKNSITDEQIAELATILAESGDTLNFENNILAADIPSTGGLGSLSTILTPLVLTELDFIVPKLGIAGRPAGGIDVLFQIPNYKIHFSRKEVLACLEMSKYCHFLVGNNYAPLDSVLFKYRSNVKAKAVPALVIASILSKKIAAGLKVTGLDVRVSSFGNFGITWNEAIQNARQFITVANMINIKAVCYLNNFNVLQQPYIGRGESLLAVHNIFNDVNEPWLTNHLYRCIEMAIELDVKGNLVSNIPLKVLKKNFEYNLIAQGSSMDNFYKKVEEVEKEHIHSIVSQTSGFLKINLFLLRELLVNYQKIQESPTDLFPDPCGIIFKKKSQDYVQKGEIILTYRIIEKFNESFLLNLSRVIEVEARYEQDFEFQIIK
ncbi:MAG: hypothetical protein ABIN01_18205 [Ferruginibacter sp.]